MAANDLSVLSLCVAMRSNSLSLQKKFSTRWRPLEQGFIERASVETIFALGNDHAAPCARMASMIQWTSPPPVSKNPPEICSFKKGSNIEACRNADRG